MPTGGQLGAGGGPQSNPFTARLVSPIPPAHHHQQQQQQQAPPRLASPVPPVQQQQQQAPPRLALSGPQPSAFASVPAPQVAGGGLVRANAMSARPALSAGHNGPLAPAAGPRGFGSEPQRLPGPGQPVYPAGSQGQPPPPNYPAGTNAYPATSNGYPTASHQSYPATSNGYPTASHQGYPATSNGDYPARQPAAGQWPGPAAADSASTLNGPLLPTNAADGQLSLASGHPGLHAGAAQVREGRPAVTTPSDANTRGHSQRRVTSMAHLSHGCSYPNKLFSLIIR